MGYDRKLNIWLIRESEPHPNSGGRLMRIGMLARYLAGQGHEVTWWSSSFLHGEKRYCSDAYREEDVSGHERLILLHTYPAYQKNISLRRIGYHRRLARAFRRHSVDRMPPDIILCCWPTQQFAAEAVRYGKKHDIPVIIDVRDLWPDIFVRVFPRCLQWMGRLALIPWELSARRIMKSAAGITGVMPLAVQWGCAKAGRKPGALDRHIFIGCDDVELSEEALGRALRWWEQRNVSEKTWNICFFSTLGKKHQDLQTVILAVQSLSGRCPDIRLIVGGKGDAEKQLREMADGCPNVVFAGWLDEEKMASAMRISKCGMYCMKNTREFRDAFSNKAIQYLEGGLPLISSPKGFAKTFLQENGIGFTYEEGDLASCAEMIERLYLDEPLRREMARRAREQFEKQFESSIVNRQFEQYIYEILDHAGKEPGRRAEK